MRRSYGQQEKETHSSWQVPVLGRRQEVISLNRMFQEIYYSLEFQNRIELVFKLRQRTRCWRDITGDEMEVTAQHFCHEYYRIFFSSYGKLSTQLFFCKDKLILLLCATCCPLAVNAILINPHGTSHRGQFFGFYWTVMVK
ncbi:hypothetical protein VP01_921g4, partial [Puccinia sorghi]